MRPHVLFFDEAYNEEFYRKETVMKKIEEFDILFVVGTMLETNLALKIVENFASKNKIIIEINPEPKINYS
jgi:NAD-dependent deacetylase